MLQANENTETCEDECKESVINDHREAVLLLIENPPVGFKVAKMFAFQREQLFPNKDDSSVFPSEIKINYKNKLGKQSKTTKSSHCYFHGVRIYKDLIQSTLSNSVTSSGDVMNDRIKSDEPPEGAEEYWRCCVGSCTYMSKVGTDGSVRNADSHLRTHQLKSKKSEAIDKVIFFYILESNRILSFIYCFAYFLEQKVSN